MPFVDLNALLITENKLNGIIYKLKRKYNNEYILSKLVKPLSSRNAQGSVNEVVTWDLYRYQAGYDALEKAWIQLSFPLGLIYPTAYSMRGVNTARCFCNQWKVYGIHEGDESTETNWELLGENRSSESTYCKIVDIYNYCNDTGVGTYTMNSKKGFKHLRWMNDGSCGSSCGVKFLAVSAIDIYGKLSYLSYLSIKNHIQPRSLYLIIVFLVI